MIYMTGMGENYMRALEAGPGIARTLTVGGVKEMWSVSKGTFVSVAGSVLAELVKHHQL